MGERVGVTPHTSSEKRNQKVDAEMKGKSYVMSTKLGRNSLVKPLRDSEEKQNKAGMSLGVRGLDLLGFI